MVGPNNFSTLSQYALNTLYCPVILTECERMFSSIKKPITPERNILADDIIKACEYLKAYKRIT
jgi:hypothetical protein